MPADYEFAGTDLSDFVSDWIQGAERPDAPTAGLLEHTATGPKGERYSYGGHFVMANIAPNAMPEKAPSRETRLFYAVIVAYQKAKWPGADEWQGVRPHVDRAFQYAHSLGLRGMTGLFRQILAEWDERDHDDPNMPKFARKWREDPARVAQFDAEMATIRQRDVDTLALLEEIEAGEA